MEAVARTQLQVLETVLCLDCGEVYAKPAAGSTVQKNPGCPQCAYVGWIPLSISRADPAGRRRFASGRRRHLFVR